MIGDDDSREDRRNKMKERMVGIKKIKPALIILAYSRK